MMETAGINSKAWTALTRYYGHETVGSIPQDLQRTNVQQLLKMKHSFHCDVTSNITQERQKWTGPVALENLEKRKVLLVGTLTTSPKHRATGEYPGCLYFEDDSGAILAEMLKPCRQDLEKMVVLSSWNYIYAGGGVYLEVLGPCVHMEVQKEKEDCQEYQSLDVMSVQQVAKLLQFQNHSQAGVVSVCGPVAAVSEVIRVKKDFVFLVQLSGSSDAAVNVLVKDPKLLHWQKFIPVQEEMVFTHLRPTTLYKGTAQETTILLPWKGADFFPAGETRINVLPLWDWICKYGEQSTADPDIEKCTPCENNVETCCSSQKLYSYKGIVTSVDKANQGIYELDHRIRVYVTHIPAVHKFASLRLGATITVYNVHHKGAPQPPRLSLGCCMFSCVRVTSFSPFKTPSQMFQHSGCVLIHLVNKLDLSLAQFDSLRDAKGKLHQKFCPGIISENDMFDVPVCLKERSRQSFPVLSPGGILHRLLTVPSPVSQKPLLTQGPRQMLVEFLHHERNGCRLVKGAPNFVCFPTICDILNHANSAACQPPVHAPSTSGRVTSADWSYTTWDSYKFSLPWVVVGILQTCKTTGHLQLADLTGSIKCVIAPDTSDTLWHKCSDRCVTRNDSGSLGGATSHCPFAQICALGCVLRIDRCHLVLEMFRLQGQPCDAANHMAYVTFSMNNVIFVHSANWLEKTLLSVKKRKCVEACNQLETQKVKHEKLLGVTTSVSDDTGTESREKPVSMDCEQHVSQLFVLLHKDCLSIRSQINARSSLSFYASVVFIGEPSVHPAGQHTKSDVRITKLKLNQAGCVSKQQTETRRTSPCSSHRTYEGTDVTQNSIKGKVGAGKEVALAFSGQSVRWYHLLHCGHIYRLVKLYCADTSVFRTKLNSEALQKAVEGSNTKQCITVQGHMIVLHVGTSKEVPVSPLDSSISQDLESKLCGLSVDEYHVYCAVQLKIDQNLRQSVLTVEEVLDSGRTLVSLKCQICWRRYENKWQHQSSSRHNCSVLSSCTLERLGVSPLTNSSVHLMVRDLDGPAEMPVYLNLAKVSYPLGLLPGAKVEFHKLERKVSKNGQVYCQFMTASSMRVVGLPGKISDQGSTRSGMDGPVDLSTAPHMYLGDLWKPGRGFTLFHSFCNITQVLKVQLKATCVECGNLHKGGQCSFVSCGSTAWPHVQASASFIVDDGTSSSLVHCHQSAHVACLLDLSTTQWTELELLVHQQGELTHDQKDPSLLESHGEMILAQLCNSQLVRRQIRLYARCNKSKGVPQGGLHGMLLQDFNLKTLKVGPDFIETYALPLLQLHCVSMETIDYNKLISHLLK